MSSLVFHSFVLSFVHGLCPATSSLIAPSSCVSALTALYKPRKKISRIVCTKMSLGPASLAEGHVLAEEILNLFFGAVQDVLVASVMQGNFASRDHALYFVFQRKGQTSLCYEVLVPSQALRIRNEKYVQLHFLNEGCKAVAEPFEPNCKIYSSIETMISITSGQTKPHIALLRGLLKLEGERALFGSNVHRMKQAANMISEKNKLVCFYNAQLFHHHYMPGHIVQLFTITICLATPQLFTITICLATPQIYRICLN